jgi:hypothetical protein
MDRDGLVRNRDGLVRNCDLREMNPIDARHALTDRINDKAGLNVMRRTSVIVVLLMLSPTLLGAPILLSRTYLSRQSVETPAVVCRYGISGIRTYYARLASTDSNATLSPETRRAPHCVSPFGSELVP